MVNRKCDIHILVFIVIKGKERYRVSLRQRKYLNANLHIAPYRSSSYSVMATRSLNVSVNHNVSKNSVTVTPISSIHSQLLT